MVYRSDNIGSAQIAYLVHKLITAFAAELGLTSVAESALGALGSTSCSGGSSTWGGTASNCFVFATRLHARTASTAI